MKTVSVISQKGGVGKTTLATAIAVEGIRRGQRVVMFDLDPQASATFWSDTRREGGREDLAITAIPASRLAHVLDAVRGDGGADLAVVDTPPFAKDIAYEAAAAADLVLMPVRPAVLDIMALTKTIDLVKAYGRRYAVVLNFCQAFGKEVEDTADVIGQLGAPLAPVRIGNRIAYSRAQQTGQAAQEIDNAGKAADEIKELYEYVCMNLTAEGAR